MKFGTMMRFDPLDCSDRYKFKISKIQDGAGHNLEKYKNRHILAAV